LKLCVDGTTSAPFPAWTLPLATSSNQNKEKVIKVSNERYAKPKSNQPSTLQIPPQVAESNEPQQNKQTKPKSQDNSQVFNEDSKASLPNPEKPLELTVQKQELELPSPEP